jgi:hypothetical protein
VFGAHTTWAWGCVLIVGTGFTVSDPVPVGLPVDGATPLHWTVKPVVPAAAAEEIGGSASSYRWVSRC